VQRAILEAYPDADIRVSLVWIPMVEGDSLDAAQVISRVIVDSRVRHFFDANKRAGEAIAASLGGAGKIAWDIYLFFPKESRWTSHTPAPQFWMHQLTRSVWADAAHRHCGDALLRELGQCMQALGFRPVMDAD
jgi:hypothetical protein